MTAAFTLMLIKCLGFVNGDPVHNVAVSVEVCQIHNFSHTELDAKDMRPVVGLDEDDLVLMAVIQRTLLVLFDREMEDSRVRFYQLDEIRVFSVVGRDDVCTAEAKLRVSPRDEHGAVVDRNRYDLFCRLGKQRSVVPQRGRWDRVTEEVRVLREGMAVS